MKPKEFAETRGKMSEKSFKFYVSANGVWLIDEVPPEFLTIYEPK